MEIGLQDLIYHVKQELLAPNPAQRAKDPVPLFFIDRLELEISVKISREQNGGIKIAVLDFAEVGVGQSRAEERAQVIRISLSPLISKDKIIEAIEDPKTLKRLQENSERAVMKGIPIYGTPE